MSGKHICICGKNRGQSPITITVTQCPKNHEIKTTGLESFAECDTYSPKKEQSPREEHASEPNELKNTEKSTTITETPVEEHVNKETSRKIEESSEKSKEKSAQSLREESIHESHDLKKNKDTDVESHSEKQTDNNSTGKTGSVVDNETKGLESVEKSEDQTEEAPQEENISEPDTSRRQTVDSVQVNDHQNEAESEVNEKSSHQVEDGSVETEEQKQTDDVKTAEPETKNEIPEDVREEESIEDPNINIESVAENQSESENVDDQTVMYMMDVSSNTTPFLDNLFVARPKTSLKSSSDYHQCKQCMLEIFVFGRHTKNCKYSFMDQNLLNCLSDGNTILEAVGKLSFPIKRKGVENDYSVYSHLNSNILKGKTIIKNELASIYASTFRKLEAHIKKDRLIEMMKHRNQADYSKTEQIDHRQNSTDKEIQLDRNSSIHAFNDFCVQFTSLSAPSITRAIQFDQNDHKTESKWYDIFFKCFGIKANENCSIDEGILTDKLHGISSIEISKYLKI